MKVNVKKRSMKEKYEYERAKGAKINHQTFINKLKRDFDGVFFQRCPTADS